MGLLLWVLKDALSVDGGSWSQVRVRPDSDLVAVVAVLGHVGLAHGSDMVPVFAVVDVGRLRFVVLL